MNKQILTTFVLPFLLVIIQTNGNYPLPGPGMQGGYHVLPGENTSKQEKGPVMPGAYSAVMWAGPMIPGQNPTMSGANPMMQGSNSIVSGAGHMIPRADVMMSGVAHNTYPVGDPLSALREGDPRIMGKGKSKITMEELAQAQKTTRKESYYEPYYKDGHWVFNRKPTDITTVGTTTSKKPHNSIGDDSLMKGLKMSYKSPTTTFACDQICPQVYGRSGKVCGMIMEQYWHRWYMRYFTFENLCMLKIRNCNTAERWHYVHRGECPESYYNDFGYGWYQTDPLSLWGIVSRAMHFQGTDEIPQTSKHYAIYTNWWDVWRRSGNVDNSSDASNSTNDTEQRISVKRIDIGWDKLKLSPVPDSLLSAIISSRAHSRRKIIRGVTQSMMSSIITTNAPSRPEITLTTAGP